MDAPDLDDVVARELSLLDPEVRADRARLTDLLDEDFSEVGASGRLWSRASVVKALVGERAGAGPVEVQDVRAVALGPDAVLVTYRSDPGGRPALRTSVWWRRGGTWRLLRHHGTLTPDGVPGLS